MVLPFRLVQVACLIFAATLGLLVTGCAGDLGAPSLSAPAAPSPTASSHHQAHSNTALHLLLGFQYGSLTPRNASVTCGANDSKVVVRGSVQRHFVTVRLSGLHKGQQLSVPPPLGGYIDRVTVTVSGASPTQSLTYIVGFTDGTYQGVGTIDVSKHGTSGTINISAPSPVGQEPLLQGAGLYVTTGANGMSLDGTWRCP
ncbi:MAG: hypothetical protein WAO09_10555 [Candidatus Dormiibacterota bacterium]